MGKRSTSRTVERHCIEVEKSARWNKYESRHKLEHVQPFIPEHDFAGDDVYLKMTANMSGRDIEWAKARTMGYNSYQALRQIHPTIGPQAAANAAHALEKRPDLQPLLEHFTTLWAKYHNPLSFSPLEAVENMIADARSAPVGRIRFQMMKELITVLGIEQHVKDAATSVLTLDARPVEKVESVNEFLDRIQSNGRGLRDQPRNDMSDTHEPL